MSDNPKMSSIQIPNGTVIEICDSNSKNSIIGLEKTLCKGIITGDTNLLNIDYDVDDYAYVENSTYYADGIHKVLSQINFNSSINGKLDSDIITFDEYHNVFAKRFTYKQNHLNQGTISANFDSFGTGFYAASKATNAPNQTNNAWMVLSFNVANMYGFQIAIGYSPSEVYARRCWSGWTSWVKLS